VIVPVGVIASSSPQCFDTSDVLVLFKKDVFFSEIKKLNSLKHCAGNQIARIKLQNSFCDLEHV